MLRKLSVITTLFLLLVVLAVSAEPFTVRVVYFQPTDTPDLTAKIQEIIGDVHQYYADEMQRHGFGNKTFRVEKNANDQISVHRIQGKHDTQHYINAAEKTYHAIKPELPIQFQDLQYSHLIVVGGHTFINQRLDGMGVVYYGGTANGGYALIPANKLWKRLITHELAHTFGLQHHTGDGCDCVMETDTGFDGFTHYEARWLDKSFYLNPNPHVLNGLPEIVKAHPMTRVDDKITYKVELASQNGLYQAEIARPPSHYVIATHYLTGKQRETATFTLHRHDLKSGTTVLLRVMDTKGILRYKALDIEVPAPKVKNIETIVEPEPDPVSTEKPETEQPKGVSVQRKVVVLWAKMKTRRSHF